MRILILQSLWGHWMDASVFWTMCAAIATTASALVIGWQSFETRKNASEAKRAADAANDALDLTRQQAKYSQVMAAEAIRSRMEAQGPTITTYFSDRGLDGSPKPYGYAIGEGLDCDKYQQIEPGHTFLEIRDDHRWLFAVLRVNFKNTGMHPVTISTPAIFGKFANQQLSVSRRRILLPAGDDAPFGGGFMLVGARVSQWIYVAKQSQRQHFVGGSTAWWTELEGESGVRVSQDLKIMGTLLESGNQNGEWRLRGFGQDVNYPSSLVVEPQRRHYVIGVDRNGKEHELPSLEPDEVVSAQGHA